MAGGDERGPPPPGAGAGEPQNLRAVLQYEGTRYAGWERQTNGIGIQEILEAAIRRITGETVTVHASGRTDAGVHAEGQVVSFHLRRRMPQRKLRLGLNAVMPDDIAVIDIVPAAPDFHARFSARSKVYRYSIWNADWPAVLGRHLVHHVPQPLDVGAMREAAAHLVGRHDFRAFTKEADRRASTVRNVLRVEIRTAGSAIHLEFEAEGFLYNMVRIATGTLIEVGRGATPPSSVKEILEGRDRTKAGPTAPASGLCLVSVFYG